MSNWISVEKRMPDFDKYVLVFDGYGVGVAKRKFYDIWVHYNSIDEVDNVTHWMPLPEPPKSE